ncbi:MAG: hypothetical protein EHM21_06675 [Chloroflexi bacterium]|nr:MAG: hypothetical protein EHM21_06675 [Chloroflexota bacterium]
MILLKIALTITMVTTLSIVAERVSPRAAGILSGYPLGSAIALFFIGLEQDARFAGISAIYNIAGLAAQVSAYSLYFFVSRRMKKGSLLAAPLVTIAGFLAVDGLIHAALGYFDPVPGWACVLVGAAGLLVFGFLFRAIPSTRIAQKIHLGPGVLLFRAGMAALTVLVITGAASLVPPSWAGLFSAFPVASFPLILIIHATYGPEQPQGIIKNIPTGLWALVFYSLTISVAYPSLGIYWGTLAGFGMATLYLLALSGITRRKRISPTPAGIK